MDGALPAEVGRDGRSVLRVLADDSELVPAGEHPAANAPRHVAGADDRDFHGAFPSAQELRAGAASCSARLFQPWNRAWSSAFPRGAQAGRVEVPVGADL